MHKLLYVSHICNNTMFVRSLYIVRAYI
jgi:hypothetical protein